MKFDWTLNLGTILGVVSPLVVAIWLSVRGLYSNVEKLGEAVTRLESRMGDLEKRLEDAAATADTIRRDVNQLSHRVTRLDTLVELMIPGSIADPAVRSLARDIVQVREQGSGVRDQGSGGVGIG